MKTQIFNPPYDNTTVDYCVQELKKGKLGIFPTDTVYGIGCDSLNLQSIQKLYDAKSRSLNKPINVVVSNIHMVNNFVKIIKPIEQRLMEYFWPGGLTIIFDKSEIVPDLLTSNFNTIGIRMPDNKICLKIIEYFGMPIAMSSANIADSPPDSNLKALLADFNNKVSFIINENLDNKTPSTIVRVEDNEIIILREGSITKSDILKCFGGNINVR